MRGRRRARPGSKHLSLSMTDEDWEVVRANAARERLSIARYVVELVERAARTDADEPTLSLDAGEQRELIETVRRLPALVRGDEDAPPLIVDFQLRVVSMFDSHARDTLREGRRDQLRAILVSRLGAEQADRYLAGLMARDPPSTPPPARVSIQRSEPDTLPEQGDLFS